MNRDNWIEIKPLLPKEVCLTGISPNLCSSIQGKDCYCKRFQDAMKSQLTQDHGEVLAFHPKWIHPDWNPLGIRAGFVNGEQNFYSAEWNDGQDTYQNSDESFPTHWMPYPQSPELLTPVI